MKFGVSLVSALIASQALHAGDWQQFLGPNRDGISKETGLIDRLSPAAEPVWRINVGAGYAGPVVVRDRVLLFHFKEGKEVVESFRTTDGTSVWTAGYPCDYEGGMFREPGPRATPTVSGDAVVTFGSDGVLQCLSLADGAVRWRKALQKEFDVPDSYFGVACSPLVADGLVLVNLGARGAGLCAFRLADGSLAWKTTDDSASYSSPVLATLNGRSTALFFARSGLHGVDPKTGDERFFFPFRARIDASVNAAAPLVWDDHVFLSASYGTGAVLLDCKEKPKVVWKSNEVLSAHFNTPVKVGGFLYGIDGRQEGGDARLVCVDAETGALKWSQAAIGCASLIAADGKLFATRENGELLLCRATSDRFEQLGTASAAKGTCRAAPALAEGRIYLRSDRELVCVDVRKKP